MNTTTDLNYATDLLHKAAQESYDKLEKWDIRVIEDPLNMSLIMARAKEQDVYNSYCKALGILVEAS